MQSPRSVAKFLHVVMMTLSNLGDCHEKFGPGVKSGPAGPILVGQNWSAPAKTGPICARMKLRLVIAAALQSRQLWTALMWEISLLRYTNTLQKEGKQKLIVRYLS